MIRLSTAGAVALALSLGGLALSSPARAMHHEPVVQVVTVRVEPGELDAYLKQVKKLMGVMSRLGSSGKVRAWNTTAGGPDTGSVIVGIEYPNQEAWAKDGPRIQNDSEWRAIVDDLHEIRTLEGSSIWRDISPNTSGASTGSVLLITGVAVHPGQLEEYRKRVGRAEGISKRLGLKGRPRMWHAIVAGPNTGGVVVGIEYPDLTTYVAEQTKLAGDAEWQKLIAGLDPIRTLTGRWLYQEITP